MYIYVLIILSIGVSGCLAILVTRANARRPGYQRVCTEDPGVLPTYGATVTNGCLVDSDESTCSSDEDFEKL